MSLPKGDAQDSGSYPLAATSARAIAAFFSKHLAGTEERRRVTVISAVIVMGFGAAMATLSSSLVVELRIVNATGSPLLVSIDGNKPVRVASVAAETPEAGLSARLFAGRHELSATTEEGTVVDARPERLSGGSTYLYAPGAAEQCFWVQHDAYGESRPELPLLAMLEGGPMFHLPREIDAWFSPNPPPSTVDRASSGGTRTAVRMARCGLPPWR